MRLESQILITRRAMDVEPMRIERKYKPDEWIEMRINPQRISISFRKVIQRIQTNTRWVFQHWGMEPVVLRYSGVTGYIRGVSHEVYTDLYLEQDQAYDITKKRAMSPAQQSYISPYETPAYQALMMLRQFYEEPHKQLQGRSLTQLRGSDIDDELDRLLLKLNYRESSYVGYLTRMEIREEETNPWMWFYDMEFISYLYEARTSLTRKKMMELVNTLFATTPGFNTSADQEIAKVWARGIEATVGGTD